MRDWRGARPVAQGRRWLVLLTETAQQPNGSWRYVYSIRPGVTVTWVTGGGFGIVSPYDPAITNVIRGISDRFPAARF